MNFPIVSALLLAFPALGHYAWAAPTGKLPAIEYAAPDQSIWTTRENDRGEPDNPLQGYAGALFAKAGMSWHGRSYPAARLFKSLQEGNVHFSILVKSSALGDCCLLSRKPVATAEIRVYHAKGQAAIRQREDLNGKRVITVRGYSYGGLRDYFANPANRIAANEAPTHTAAFRMLASGRADYLVDYAGPAGEILAMEPLPNLQYDVLARQDVHLVLSRAYPGATAVMGRLEAAAETLDVGKFLDPSRR